MRFNFYLILYILVTSVYQSSQVESEKGFKLRVEMLNALITHTHKAKFSHLKINHRFIWNIIKSRP